MKTKRQRIKYKTTAMVCKYVMKATKISGRTLAQLLDVHFTTWHRYARGEHRPNAEIKSKLVLIMEVENFIELIHLAYRSSHPRHY